MSTYLIINIIIVFFPLIISLTSKARRLKWKALLASIVLVGGFFVLWDLWAISLGDWYFNSKFINGARLAGLPYEELLFFVTVPFSCLYLYEGMRKYLLNRKWLFFSKYSPFLTIVFLVLSLAAHSHSYSLKLFLLCALLFFLSASLRVFTSSLFWMWIAVCTLLFMLFNYFLTSLPVVIYNPNAILNFRVLTIPIEDFFYNFALLTLFLKVYLLFDNNRGF